MVDLRLRKKIPAMSVAGIEFSNRGSVERRGSCNGCSLGPPLIVVCIVIVAVM
jgi:hypothetical protein